MLASAESQHHFILNYYTAKNRYDKMSIHVRDKDTNLSLMRVNIDPSGFHKNSDGGKIIGNRMLFFSTEEWFSKGDGTTYVRAYNIPKEFTNLNDLEQVFLDFLLYINVKKEGKIKFSSLI